MQALSKAKGKRDVAAVAAHEQNSEAEHVAGHGDRHRCGTRRRARPRRKVGGERLAAPRKGHDRRNVAVDRRGHTRRGGGLLAVVAGLALGRAEIAGRIIGAHEHRAVVWAEAAQHDFVQPQHAWSGWIEDHRRTDEPRQRCHGPGGVRVDPVGRWQRGSVLWRRREEREEEAHSSNKKN